MAGKRQPLVPFTDEEIKLRRRILDMGYTHSQVAELVGITRQDVSKIVKGKSKCPRYIHAVYKFLGFEDEIPPELLGG
ncbi:MAG: helix-turn-helix domain-containing protein [Turicibacter sp.]|nr:helix-turn-helix domain-containing protein [Turicibacter sp.]